MMQSTSCSLPSAVTMRLGVTRVMASATSSTFGR
jgi:hypothetical protein